MIHEFSKETAEKLRHYVYRLVDPRTGETFYVGEGCGNRVFAHANAAGMSFYDSGNQYLDERDVPTEEDKDPAKVRRIADIRRCGLEPIHIIQRWGMDKKTAFEVEAAFIDFLGLDGLTNKARGHGKDRGMRWADELELELTANEFPDYPDCPKFILIKINDYHIGRTGSVYETVRGYWKLRASKANRYDYVLAVRHGIVIGVYKVGPDGWKQCEGSRRAYFDGAEAPVEIQEIFLNKKIPARFRRRQNPATYCD